MFDHDTARRQTLRKEKLFQCARQLGLNRFPVGNNCLHIRPTNGYTDPELQVPLFSL